ncbi:hypothetical protein JZ751_004003, partial [Albula glossodonta]
MDQAGHPESEMQNRGQGRQAVLGGDVMREEVQMSAVSLSFVSPPLRSRSSWRRKGGQRAAEPEPHA